MSEIQIRGGQVALCDEEDYPILAQHKWYLNNKGYAYRYNGYYWNAKGKIICLRLYMHREILGLQKGQETDHINNDPLDNHRANLRVGNRSLQTINSRRPKNISGWRGVICCKSCPGLKKIWRAQIKIHGKTISGGYFQSPRMAAFAYNEMALKHFGPQFRFFNQVFRSVKE